MPADIADQCIAGGGCMAALCIKFCGSQIQVQVQSCAAVPCSADKALHDCQASAAAQGESRRASMPTCVG